jgi:hypothetical protein
LDSRDRAAIFWLLFCGAYIAVGGFLGGMYWRYFPSYKRRSGKRVSLQRFFFVISRFASRRSSST